MIGTLGALRAVNAVACWVRVPFRGGIWPYFLNESAKMELTHWQDAVVFVVDRGRVTAAFFLKITPPASVSLNAANRIIIAGVVVAAVAGSALYAYQQREEWVLGYTWASSDTTTALVAGQMAALFAGANVLWTGGSTRK